MSPCQIVIDVHDISQVGEARRAASRLAEAQKSLGETERGAVAIIVTELATNLARHTPGGQILLQPVQMPAGAGIEVLSIDRGPGMANVAKCMEDGYSTGGTAGNGLGAVRRLSTDFDLFSERPAGTVIVSRILRPATPAQPGSGRLQWGVVCLPAPGETECGDAWSIAWRDGAASLLMADGLGHGPMAAKASGEAVRIFETNPFRPTIETFENAHWPLRSTRGAAMATARIDLVQRNIRYTGVGNISGTIIFNGNTQSLCSHNGTVGLHMRKVQEFEYAWPAGAILALHSDGLNTRWTLQKYAGLANRDPSVIAGVLYRDFLRGKDDVTVLVVK